MTRRAPTSATTFFVSRGGRTSSGGCLCGAPASFRETFRGRDKILAVFDRWGEEWSAVRFELDECIEVDEGRVLTVHKVIATGRGSGAQVVRELASVMDIREGLVVRDWIYRDRDEALEAAGLSE